MKRRASASLPSINNSAATGRTLRVKGIRRPAVTANQMAANQGAPLSELVSAASAIADETLTVFGEFTAQQLNWKPTADRWSVAQCFDHLVTANAAYLPIFEQVLSG